jgi:DNA-binding CsgD family transcriptional regulator
MIEPENSGDLADVVAGIYEAAVLPERWQSALAGIRGFLGGASSMFSLSYLASGRGEVIASDNVNPETISSWEQRHGISPWVRGALSKEVGAVARGHDMLPLEELRETSVYRELCEPLGILDMLGIVTVKTPLVFGAISFYDAELFEPEAVRRLEVLGPHLVRATALRNRVAWLSQRAAAFEDGVERLPVGLVLVGAAGEVVHANERARVLIEGQDGLRLETGRLALSDRTAERKLGTVLAGIREARAESSVPFLVPRPSSRRPYQILVSPSHDRVDPWHEGAALVWIHDPEETRVPSPGALEQLFGLSPAESRMAASLASGSTVCEYADEAGVTEETARFRLKQVLAKTGARRQADLVRMILSSLPGLL